MNFESTPPLRTTTGDWRPNLAMPTSLGRCGAMGTRERRRGGPPRQHKVERGGGCRTPTTHWIAHHTPGAKTTVGGDEAPQHAGWPSGPGSGVFESDCCRGESQHLRIPLKSVEYRPAAGPQAHTNEALKRVTVAICAMPAQYSSPATGRLLTALWPPLTGRAY